MGQPPPISSFVGICSSASHLFLEFLVRLREIVIDAHHVVLRRIIKYGSVSRLPVRVDVVEWRQVVSRVQRYFVRLPWINNYLCVPRAPAVANEKVSETLNHQTLPLPQLPARTVHQPVDDDVADIRVVPKECWYVWDRDRDDELVAVKEADLLGH
jgi:hypothetical protein